MQRLTQQKQEEVRKSLEVREVLEVKEALEAVEGGAPLVHLMRNMRAAALVPSPLLSGCVLLYLLYFAFAFHLVLCCCVCSALRACAALLALLAALLGFNLLLYLQFSLLYLLLFRVAEPCVL